jgi:hypothetical protein
MFITTTLTGIAVISATGTAIGTTVGIVIRPRLDKSVGEIKAHFAIPGDGADSAFENAPIKLAKTETPLPHRGE